MKKGFFTTYFYCVIGGFFGLHHLYLGRDRHAFLTFSTFAGFFGVSLLRDLIMIPTYVQEANQDRRYLRRLKQNMDSCQKPPYNCCRQLGAVCTAIFWATVFQLAVPTQIAGINLDWILLLTPIPIALAVHTVGNLGNIVKGHFFWPLVGACSIFITGQTTMGIFFASLISSTMFELISVEWNKKPKARDNSRKRFYNSISCCLLYVALWALIIFLSDRRHVQVTDTFRIRFEQWDEDMREQFRNADEYENVFEDINLESNVSRIENGSFVSMVSAITQDQLVDLQNMLMDEEMTLTTYEPL